MNKEHFEFLQELLRTLHTALDVENERIAIVLGQYGAGNIRLRIPKGHKMHYWEFDDADYGQTVSELSTRILSALDKLPE